MIFGIRCTQQSTSLKGLPLGGYKSICAINFTSSCLSCKLSAFACSVTLRGELGGGGWFEPGCVLRNSKIFFKSPRKDEVVCEMCFVWQNWKYVNRSNKQPSMLSLLLRWSVRALDGGSSGGRR